MTVDPPTRLVFMTGPGIADWIIRIASGFSPASHIAIGLGPQCEWILHAFEKGVRLEPLQDYLHESRSRVTSVHTIRHDVRSHLSRGLALVGMPYDNREIVIRVLSFVVPLLQHRALWPIRYDAWTCARFVSFVLQPVIPEWKDLPTWVTPHDLLTHTNGPSFVEGSDCQGTMVASTR